MSTEEVTEEGQNQERKCCRIDVPTLPCKIFLFFSFAVIGLILTYENVFLLSIGLTAREAGIISAFSYLAAAFVGPIWGILADKTGHRRSILITLCVGIAAISLAIPWIARELSTSTLQCTHVNTTYSPDHNQTGQESLIKEGIKMFSHNSSIFIGVEKEVINISASQLCTSKTTPVSNLLFYSMLVTSIFLFVCLIDMGSLVNPIIMNILQNNPTTQGYGQQMRFASIGIGMTSFLSGIVMDNFVHPTLSRYGMAYFIACPITLLLIPLSSYLFKYTNWELHHERTVSHVVMGGEDEGGTVDVTQTRNETGEQNLNRFQMIMKIFRNPRIFIGMLTTLLVGVLISINTSFSFLMIQDEMDGSKTSMGLTQIVSRVSGTIMYAQSERVMTLLGGPTICFEVALLSWIVRFTAFSYIRNPWLACLPQVLESLGNSLYTSALVRRVYDVSPKEIIMTSFMIMASLKVSGGGFLGNIIGGYVYNTYKGPVLFRGAAVVAAAWLVVHFMCNYGITLIKRLFTRRGNGNMASGNDTRV